MKAQTLSEQRGSAPPFFSIAIPHYSRGAHLLEQLRQLGSQTFRDFEVCISEDPSENGRGEDVVALLQTQSIAHAYVRNPRALRYDANLRSAISLCEGRYCLLMGNDDMLDGIDALARIAHHLEMADWPDVFIGNFRDWGATDPVQRVPAQGFSGAGANAALAVFRNVSFVSGVVLKRQRCIESSTTRWDGSEMYQMYLAIRLLATGGAVLEVPDCLVVKDIAIEDVSVESYLDEKLAARWPIVLREKPLTWLPLLVCETLRQSISNQASAHRAARKGLFQLYAYTFPYWLIQYRKVQHRSYAIGLAWALMPFRTLRQARGLWLVKLICTAQLLLALGIAMVLPLGWFERFRPALHRIAKRIQKKEPQ